jgi:hypothetical protein
VSVNEARLTIQLRTSDDSRSIFSKLIRHGDCSFTKRGDGNEVDSKQRRLTSKGFGAFFIATQLEE